MTMRPWLAGIVLTLALAGCDSAKREKARVDSIAADSLLQVARRQSVADSAHRADSIAAATAAVKTKAPVSKPKPGAAKGTIIGRDSVNTKPKVIGMPVVADTAKRKPLP